MTDAPISMEVKGLIVDPVANTPMVLLRESGSPEGREPYVLPLWVGIFEANAIALPLEQIESPRPMTHDLLRDVLERLGARVEQVVITDVRESTFYAALHVRQGETVVVVDARPSDAIALALRTGAPILVDPVVIERAKAFDVGSEDPDKLRAWFENLQTDALGGLEP